MQPSYPVSLLTLTMGICLSCVAGYFSVVGIGTIFSGAFFSAVIMAAFLETSKVVAASWLYRHWNIAPIAMRIYMSIAIIVLVLITSMGIFGYLSKAHLDQTLKGGGDNELRIENLQRKIQREQRSISDAETLLSQLDNIVETLQEYDRIRGPDGAIAVRASQAEERQRINETIVQSYDRIEELENELLPLRKKSLSLEAEIGPLKYIAQLIYGESYDLENSVRFIILVIVLVFDPLAITLILAGNTGISYHEKSKRQRLIMNDKGEYIETNRVKNMIVEDNDLH